MHISAMKVNQWLPQWDEYKFQRENRQKKPERFFYLSSIPVGILRRLSGIPRRGLETESGRQQASGPRVEDIGIQRGLDKKRAKDIKAFVKAGYPWATLSEREKDRFTELKKPGWLPTALVVNIVKDTTERDQKFPSEKDLIEVEELGNNMVKLILPDNVESSEWRRAGPIPTLEVIDGQHRLLAFDEDELENEDFELPVVLFVDLDISWQAYLFWTINITPKRIGPSLAYDLYPLLRTEDWLEPVPGPLAYRETRAQELTEALWSNPDSPWYQRIGMLGRERGKVTQAAFVRSLTQSFIRRSDPGGNRPGGLFGASLSDKPIHVLPWNRAQQAAYLIFIWSELERAIKKTDAPWAENVREKTKAGQLDLIDDDDQDAAFAGKFSLLATDQGVRGFLQVSNDISFVLAESLELASLGRNLQQEATEIREVAAAVSEFESHPIASVVQDLCECTALFDWRSSVTPGLSEREKGQQAQFRAGSGYREVRRQLLLHLLRHAENPIRDCADRIIKALKFNT